MTKRTPIHLGSMLALACAACASSSRQPEPSPDHAPTHAAQFPSNSVSCHDTVPSTQTPWFLPKDPAQGRIAPDNLEAVAARALSACGDGSDQRLDAPAEQALLVSAMRYLFEHNGSGTQKSADILYLAIAHEFSVNGIPMEALCDPPSAILGLLGQSGSRVAAVSSAPSRLEQLCLQRIPLIFYLSTVTWNSTEEALVEGGYYESRTSASRSRLLLRRGAQGWTVESETSLWIAALSTTECQRAGYLIRSGAAKLIHRSPSRAAG